MEAGLFAFFVPRVRSDSVTGAPWSVLTTPGAVGEALVCVQGVWEGVLVAVCGGVVSGACEWALRVAAVAHRSLPRACAATRGPYMYPGARFCVRGGLGGQRRPVLRPTCTHKCESLRRSVAHVCVCVQYCLPRFIHRKNSIRSYGTPTSVPGPGSHTHARARAYGAGYDAHTRTHGSGAQL